MNQNEHKVIIIGAGLTGLTLAYLLKKKGVDALILEARNRLGGRIHTAYKADSAPIELGATWLGKQHRNLIQLLEELAIQTFVQELSSKAIYEPISTSPPQLVTLPPNDNPSYRIKDGSSHLIHQLANKLDSKQIHLSQVVASIKQDDQLMNITTDKGIYQANWVVSTLPPNLLVSNITFSPSLTDELIGLARATHTWMGESIKIALRFETPFWNDSSSATMFSNVGPVSELYDHSDFEGQHHALKGFMNGGFYGASKEERRNFVLNQLSKYYGEKVRDYVSYEDCAWKNEQYTFAAYGEYILPHQNNGDQMFQKGLYDSKFFIAGSETALTYPGYMDGAVESAKKVCDQLMNQYLQKP